MDLSLELILIICLWIVTNLALFMFSDKSAGDSKFTWLINILFLALAISCIFFPEFFSEITKPFRLWVDKNLRIHY